MGLSWQIYIVRKNSETMKGINEIKIIPLPPDWSPMTPSVLLAARDELSLRWPESAIESYTVEGDEPIQIDKLI